MNVERLNLIVKTLLAEINNTKLDGKINNLSSAIKNAINQPQQPQHQRQLAEHLSEIRKVSENSAVNDFSPAWKQITDELDITPYMGNELSDTLDDIFERNQITLAIADKEIEVISQRIKDIKAALTNLNGGFTKFNIGAEDLEEGQCEIGVLIPRSYVGNKLDEFGDELKNVNKMLAVFSEISTGGRESFQVRTISSSDFLIFLDSFPVVAAFVATAIERIVALYKNLIEIKKLHSELEKKGVPEDRLQGVQDHANASMEEGIDDLVAELIEQYYQGDDEGRKNELAVELKFSLNQIANRVDRGFNIEVRTKSITHEETEEEATEDPDSKHYVAIEKASKNLEFIKSDGEPILSLTEGKNKKK